MAALEAGPDLDVRVDDAVAPDHRPFADPACMDEAERLDRGAVADDGIRAYDARLVDGDRHRTMIRPTGVGGVAVHTLTTARDDRGALAALELADCPFEPKRIFAVYVAHARKTSRHALETRNGRGHPDATLRAQHHHVSRVVRLTLIRVVYAAHHELRLHGNELLRLAGLAVL